MEQQGKNLQDMTIMELKALAYDFITQAEQAQINLRQVNQLIQQRLKNELVKE